MKKTILVLTLITLGFSSTSSAAAQELITQTSAFSPSAETDSVVAKKHFRITNKDYRPHLFLLRAAMTCNGVLGQEWGKNMRHNMGYDASLEYNWRIPGNTNLYYGAECGVGTRGFKYRDGAAFQRAYLQNARISPAILGWRYDMDEQITFDVHVGGYISYDFSGHYEWETNGEVVSLGLNYWREDVRLAAKWHRFDAGLRVGCGLWYNRYNLDFTWQRGFVKPWLHLDTAQHERLWTSCFLMRLSVAL